MSVAIVQSTKIDPAVGTDIVLTLGSAPTVGNVLIAFCNFSEFGSSRTISITGQGTWVKLEDVTQSFVRHAIFVHEVVGGDGTAWTFVVSEGTQPCGGEMYELSGASLTMADHQHGTTSSASTSSLAGPSLTPAVLSCQALAAFTQDTNQIANTTVGAGFTIDQTAGGAQGRGGSEASRNSLTSDTTTAITTTWTLSGGADACIASEVLIAPPSAGGPVPELPRRLQFKRGSRPNRKRRAA